MAPRRFRRAIPTTGHRRPVIVASAFSGTCWPDRAKSPAPRSHVEVRWPTPTNDVRRPCQREFRRIGPRDVRSDWSKAFPPGPRRCPRSLGSAKCGLPRRCQFLPRNGPSQRIACRTECQRGGCAGRQDLGNDPRLHAPATGSPGTRLAGTGLAGDILLCRRRLAGRPAHHQGSTARYG